jgi:hypothetical protein
VKRAKKLSLHYRGYEYAGKHADRWDAIASMARGYIAGWKAAQRDARKAKTKARPTSPMPPTSIVVIGGGGGGGTGKPIKFKEVGEWKPLPKPAGKAKKGRAK